MCYVCLRVCVYTIPLLPAWTSNDRLGDGNCNFTLPVTVTLVLVTSSTEQLQTCHVTALPMPVRRAKPQMASAGSAGQAVATADMLG